MVETEQSYPPYPGSHAHSPEVWRQAPRPEHREGQTRTEQSAASQPAAQRHLPPSQAPCPEQELGQPPSEQSTPEKPILHAHVPLLQYPWYEQSLGQRLVEQSGGSQSPPHLRGRHADTGSDACTRGVRRATIAGTHLHWPSTHEPWPEHSLGHQALEQSAPHQPGEQTHVPL